MLRFMNSPVYKQLWEEHECDLLSSCSSSSSSSPALSRSSSTDSVFYRRNRLSIKPESILKPKLGDDIEFMLASLKDFKRSFSGHSEADEGDEEYVLARDHVGQILDEIIEEVLTIEELQQINSIWYTSNIKVTHILPALWAQINVGRDSALRCDISYIRVFL